MNHNFKIGGKEIFQFYLNQPREKFFTNEINEE